MRLLVLLLPRGHDEGVSARALPRSQGVYSAS